MKKVVSLTKIIGSFFLILSSTNRSIASETDQFYAAGAVIRDSRNEINDFFHRSIESGLNRVNQLNTELTCREVASEILTQILGEFSFKEYLKDKTFSKVSYFVQKSPLVERFPNDLIKVSDYRAQTIYRFRPFPSNSVGIARTININDIFVGTDKIGHFSILGKVYYKSFLKGLDNGLSLDQAQVNAIIEGFKQEVAILGYTIGGTLSFADLEANYQGLQFARNMCEGNNPHLVQKRGIWSQNLKNPFDIKDYINPKMDEAFNVSFWAPRLWIKMKGDVVTAYCKNKKDPHFILRAKAYGKLVKNSVNDQLIDDFVKMNPKFNRLNQLLLEQNCLDKI